MLPMIATSDKTFRDIIEEQTDMLFEGQVAISDGIHKLNKQLKDLLDLTELIFQFQVEAHEDAKRRYFEEKEIADEARRKQKSGGTGGGTESVKLMPSESSRGGLFDSLLGLFGEGAGAAVAGAAGAGIFSRIKALFTTGLAKKIFTKAFKLSLAGIAVSIVGNVLTDLVATNVSDDPAIQANIKDVGGLAIDIINNLLIARLFGPAGWIIAAVLTLKDMLDLAMDREQRRIDTFLNNSKKYIEDVLNDAKAPGKAAAVNRAIATLEQNNMLEANDVKNAGEIYKETMNYYSNKIKGNEPVKATYRGKIAETLASILYYMSEDQEAMASARSLYEKVRSTLSKEQTKKNFDQQIKSKLNLLFNIKDRNELDNYLLSLKQNITMKGDAELKSLEDKLKNPTPNVSPVEISPDDLMMMAPPSAPKESSAVRQVPNQSLEDKLKNPTPNVSPVEISPDDLMMMAPPSAPKESSAVRQVPNQSLEDMVKRFEGFSATPYRDSAGVMTIGYGRTGNISADDTVTEEQASEFLVKRLESEKNKIREYGKSIGRDWNENQLNALASFSYNLGFGNIKNLTKNGERSDEEIASMMLKYNKARVNGSLKELKGLTSRRKEESDLFLSPVKSPAPSIPSTAITNYDSSNKQSSMSVGPTINVVAPQQSASSEQPAPVITIAPTSTKDRASEYMIASGLY